MLLCPLFSSPGATHAQTTATWLSASYGEWFDPASWSTNPHYPDNGQPGAADLYDVRIDAVGSPYTVLFEGNDPGVVVDRLTIDSPDATLLMNRTRLNGFTATQGIVVDAGLLVLDAARITDTRISGVGGRVEARQFTGNQPGWFEGVTLGLDMFMGNSALIDVRGDLRLDSATLTMQGQGGFARLTGRGELPNRAGDLNLRGVGQVIMSGRSSIGAGVDSDLRIDPGIGILVDDRAGFSFATLSAGEQLINAGTITAQRDRLTIQAQTLDNLGTIRAIDQGGIDLTLSGAMMPSAQLGTLATADGGVISLRVNLDNRGSTLTFGGPALDVRFRRFDSRTPSTILGGVIDSPDGAALDLSGTEVTSATLAGTVTGDVTFNGGLVLDGGVVAVGVGTDVHFAGGQSVTGTGRIEIDEELSNSRGSLTIGRSDQQPVLFGPGVVVHSKQHLRSPIRADQWISEGTLLFDGAPVGGGSGYGVEGSFTNRGLIHVRGGNPTLSGNGQAFVNQGEVLVDPGVTLILAHGVRNEGQITLRPGSTLRYDGNNTLDALGSINNQGAEINLRGTFDLAGGTLDFQDAFGEQKDRVTYYRTRFENGTLRDTSGDLVTTSTGTDAVYFHDITFGSDTTFYSSAQATLSGTIRIEQGVSLYLGRLPDGVTDTPRATLRNTGLEDVFIEGAGTIVIRNGSDDPRDAAIESTSSRALVIGPQITVRSEGGAFTFGATNRGTIQVTGEQDVLRLDGAWRNEGRIEADAGRVLLGGDFSADDLGTIRAGSEVELSVVGRFDLAGQSLVLGGESGGRWTLNQRGRIANGTIDARDQPLRIGRSGSGTYDGIGDIEAVTLAGRLVVEDRGTLRVYEGLRLDGGQVQIGGRGDGDLVMVGGQVHIDGSGEIVFAGSNPNSELSFANYDNLPDPQAVIAPGITIRTAGASGTINTQATVLTNLGLIAADTATLTFDGAAANRNTLVNTDGTLEARNGGNLRVFGLDGDAGTLRFTDGGTIQLTGDYRLHRPLTLGDGDRLTLNDTAALDADIAVDTGGQLRINGAWTNTGSIDVNGGTLQIAELPTRRGTLGLDNGTLRLAGPFTMPQLLTLPVSDARVSVGVGGVIQNTGGSILIGGDVGALDLDGGRIDGGLIAAINDAPLTVSGLGTLEGTDLLNTPVIIGENGTLTMTDASWNAPVRVLPGGVLRLTGAGWSNLGGVVADRAVVTLQGAAPMWGSFDLDASSLVLALDAEARDLIAAIRGNASTVVLAQGAALNNTDHTLTLDPLALDWRLEGGTLRGGAVQATPGAAWSVGPGGGTIEATDIAAPLRIEAPGTLDLIGGAVLRGGLAFDTNADQLAIVRLGEAQSLDGFGEIRFGSGSADHNRIEASQPTLVLPSGMTVTAEAGGGGTIGTLDTAVVNRATLVADGAGSELRLRGATVTNNGGVLRAVDGGAIDVQWLAGPVGEVVVADDGALSLNGVYTFDRPTTLDRARLTLAGDWSLTAPMQADGSTMHWLYPPTAGKDLIRLTDSTLRLGLPASVSDLPADFAHRGNTLTTGTYADLDLGGAKLSELGFALVIDGGTVRAAQLDPAGTPIRVLSSGTLRDASVASGIELADAAVLTLHNTTINQATLDGTLDSAYRIPRDAAAGLDSATVNGLVTVEPGGRLFLANGLNHRGTITFLADRFETPALHVVDNGAVQGVGLLRFRSNSGFATSRARVAIAPGGAFELGPTAKLEVGRNERSRVDLLIEGDTTAFVNHGRVTIYGTGSALQTTGVELRNLGRVTLEGGALELDALGMTNESSGAVTGSGRVRTPATPIINHGTLGPRGLLTIDGDLVQSATGRVVLSLLTADDDPSQSDTLAVTGLASLDGELIVELTEQRTPAFMDRFHVLSLDAVEGWFQTIVLPGLPAGLAWETGALQTRGELIVAAGPGDTDGDGVVDERDLNRVTRAIGLEATPFDRLAGDLTGDGRVGIEDLEQVLDNWTPAAAPDPAQVPEPTAWLAWPLVLLGLRRRACAEKGTRR